MGDLVQHLRDQLAPSGLDRRKLAAVFPCGLGDVAGSAQRLQVVRIPRIAAPVEWRHVVAFEPARPAAQDAAVAVALEHGASHLRPSAGVQVDMVAAHILGCKISVRSERDFVIQVLLGRGKTFRWTFDSLAILPWWKRIGPLIRFFDQIQYAINWLLERL